jgi:hypothetical protein
VDDDALRKYLIGILEQMKVQQQFLKLLSIGNQALIEVLSGVSANFRDAFEQRVQDLMSGPAGQTHDIALDALDETIHRLREGGTSGFDPGKAN